MKKWKLILSVVLASLFLVITPLAVFAESGTDNSRTAIKEFKGGLAIVAPRAVPAGQEMQLTVFLRVNQNPVGDVGVWAVPQANIEKLKNEIQALRQDKNLDAAGKNYQPIIEKYAIFLGRTGNNGRLTHTFNEAGNYLLVAYKPGFWPDWSALAVRSIPKALEIKATPKKVQPGKDFNINVDIKGTNVPVSGAGVWAIPAVTIDEAKAKIQQFREANKADVQNADWDAQLNGIGMFLGRTDEKGKLTASLEKEGIYLLVTFKKGHLPGFTGIAVVAPKPVTVTSNNTAARK
jgi:hypothetical protein